MNLRTKRLHILHVPLLAVGPLFFSACATMAPPLPPSLELPKPPTDLRVVRKGDKVTLTWTIPLRTTDRKLVRSVGPTLICRGPEATLALCGAAVGQINARPGTAVDKASPRKSAGSYTDTLPADLQSNDPSATVTYAVEVRNADGRSAGLSNQVSVPLLRTVRPPALHVMLTKDGVALNWSRNVPSTNSQAQIRFVYRVFRRSADDAPWTPIGDFPAGGESDITMTDSNIEWEKAYSYRIETVSVIASAGSEQQIEGDDSEEIRVLAHDVFPPAAPTGLQSVFSGPGQKPFVDLIWAPVTDADLNGYNVYRRQEGAAPVRINEAPVKAPAYRDDIVIGGTRYFYSVSAVDLRGNESARSEEAAENVP